AFILVPALILVLTSILVAANTTTDNEYYRRCPASIAWRRSYRKTFFRTLLLGVRHD
ncbi:unnamed protein product, partial [marine sediment metagenome]